jgi:transglutaminase-like putative cysteine protease
MKLTLTHTLTFSLGTAPRAVLHLLLTPLNTAQQKVERWSIDMPGFADAATFRDGYGNRAHLVTLVKPDSAIVVTVTGTVETVDKSGVLGRLEFDPMPAFFRRPTIHTPVDSELTDGLDPAPGRIALLHTLMDRVHEKADTSGRSQDQSAPAHPSPQRGGEGGGGRPTSANAQSQSQSQHDLTSGKNAPDLPLRFIGAARSLGIAARYVTGYVVDEGKARFHAWAEAWDDGLGWIGFDPALNLCPTDAHLRLAAGLDAMTTVPVRTVPVWAEMPRETVEIVVGE